MPMKLSPGAVRIARLAAVAVPAALLVVLFRQPLLQTLELVLGAGALAFLAEPLAARFERRLSRPRAAVCAVATMLLGVGALLWLALPALFAQLTQLSGALPDSLRRLSEWIGSVRGWMQAHLPSLQLPEARLDNLAGALSGLAGGTFRLASGAGAALSRASLALMLGVFFLCDRSRLFLRLELLIPQAFRQTAVRMGGAVCRELRLYLRAQLLIALAVGALAAGGLMLAGVRSAAVLGGIIGLFNMIPYFGPFLGGAPAVLLALADGWRKALLVLGVLALVQQLDNALISPRIMGGLTGFSPAAVLLAIFAGARLFGVVGLLTALPLFMSIRTVFRVFVQSRENI